MAARKTVKGKCATHGNATFLTDANGNPLRCKVCYDLAWQRDSIRLANLRKGPQAPKPPKAPKKLLTAAQKRRNDPRFARLYSTTK